MYLYWSPVWEVQLDTAAEGSKVQKELYKNKDKLQSKDNIQSEK